MRTSSEFTRDDPQNTGTVVYGGGEFSLFSDGKLYPESFAYTMVLTVHALNTAKTWSDLRLLHPQLYEAAVDAWDAPTFDAVRDELRDDWKSWRDDDAEPSEEELREAYQDEYGQFIPPEDDEALELERVPTYEGGSWLEPYLNDPLSWVPEDVIERFGRYSAAPGVDWEGYVLVGEETEIVAALREHGFTLRKDHDLIRATQNILPEPAYSAVLEQARRFYQQ